MTIQQIIKKTETLNKEDFQNLFFELLKKANTQYNIKIYLNEYKTDNKFIEKPKQEQANKRKWKHLGKHSFGGKLDNINIRDYAYE